MTIKIHFKTGNNLLALSILYTIVYHAIYHCFPIIKSAIFETCIPQIFCYAMPDSSTSKTPKTAEDEDFIIESVWSTVFFIFFIIWHRKRLKADISYLNRRRKIWTFIAIYSAFVFTAILILFYTGLLGKTVGKNQDNMNAIFAKTPILFFVQLVAIRPFDEEIIFRKLFFINLLETDKIELEKPLESLLMLITLFSNATIFSYAHISADPTFSKFLTHYISSLLYCLGSLLTGCVSFSIIMHVVHNFIVLIFMKLGFYE